MTLQEFLEKYNGLFVEVAGSPNALNQCVDLANAYIRDVLNLPIIEWTNAKDFPSKADSAKYDWIKNEDSNYPLEGDLIVWGGTYGHIAIALSGCTADKLICFEQNNPLGTNAHVGTHTYSGVLGWLHPKQIINSDSLSACQTQLQKEITAKNETYQWGKELENDLQGAKSQIQHYLDFEKQLSITLKTETDEAKILGEITKMIGYEDQVRKLNQKTQEQATQLTVMAQNKEEDDETINTLREVNKTQADELSEQGKNIEEMKQHIVELNEELSSTTTHESLFKIGKLSICKIQEEV